MIPAQEVGGDLYDCFLIGDSLVLYTDGVTEAVDGDRNLLEDERFVTCLEHAGGEAPSEVIRDVLRAVEDFSAGAPPTDVVTLLVLRYAADGLPASPEAVAAPVSD